jgi:orotidine-5'-phosphate decarboxylase
MSTTRTGIKMSAAQSRIIVALDVSDRTSALRLIEQLDGLITSFKIGNQLFTAEGPDLVREIVGAGLNVFLDLKYHDIPNTVGRAVGDAARLGVSILNVHASGGTEMMRAAAQAAAEVGTRPSIAQGVPAIERRPGPDKTAGDELPRPAVIGVTVLTSMDHGSLKEIGMSLEPVSQAVLLARLAKQAGLDGVVASPEEIAPIREQVAGGDFIIVTPGVRPAGSESADQRRVGTPYQAIRDGADYLVIGRPITASGDPRAAVERIIEEIQ